MKAKGQVDLRIILQEKRVFCKPTLRYIHNIENIQDFTIDFEQKSSPSISDLLDGNGAAPDYLYCGYKLISAYLQSYDFLLQQPPMVDPKPIRKAEASCEGDRCDAENSALLTIPRFSDGKGGKVKGHKK